MDGGRDGARDHLAALLVYRGAPLERHDGTCGGRRRASHDAQGHVVAAPCRGGVRGWSRDRDSIASGLAYGSSVDHVGTGGTEVGSTKYEGRSRQSAIRNPHSAIRSLAGVRVTRILVWRP